MDLEKKLADLQGQLKQMINIRLKLMDEIDEKQGNLNQLEANMHVLNGRIYEIQEIMASQTNKDNIIKMPKKEVKKDGGDS